MKLNESDYYNMRYIIFLNLIFGLIFFGCNSGVKSNASVKSQAKTIKLSKDDKGEIQTLIRKMLKWSDSERVIALLPVLSKDSICIGFDFDKQNLNLEKLRRTGFFTNEFINNYNNIIQTLDRKIRNNEFEKWNVHELPPFNFANDVNPWCLCQDNLSWDTVTVDFIKLSNNKAELKWNWGKLDSSVDSSWKDFSYTFRVVKVDGEWKISYLQGFDYQESIK